ncbi:calphotin-like [Procambarus clarkii]|uniref:calphotin-like n=1 Tax=Procambarus clarkii TaxID=6728 RepID=UPI003742FAB3
MLRVDVASVCGVQLVSEHRAVVKFCSTAVYRDFVDCYDGRTFTLPGGGGSVIVSDRCSETTYVAVHGAPFEFPDSLLQRHFNRYGRVLSVRMNAVSSGRWKGIPNGTRTVALRLKDSIPSSLQLLGFMVRVFYGGQPRTCFRCGLLGHQAAGCDASRVGPVNLFREEDFPPLAVPDLSEGAAVDSVPTQSSVAQLPVSDASRDVAVGVGVGGSASPAPAPQPPLPASSPVESPVVSPVVCGLVAPDIEAEPRPVLSPAAVSSTRVDVHTVMSPAVCGPVPRIVEAAMSSDRALRGVARATSGSATVHPSGDDNSDDLRPVSKRSRRALSLSPPHNAAWADVGEFEDSGSSSSGECDVCVAVGVPAAPVGRVAAVMGPVVGLSPGPGPVSSPAASASPVAGSLGWEVVAPAEIAREGRGLVPVLTDASVPAASVPLASMSVPSTPLASAQSSFVTPSPVVSAPAPSPSVFASPAPPPARLPACVQPTPVLQSRVVPPSVSKPSVRPLPVPTAPVVEGAELEVPDFMRRPRGSRSHVNAPMEMWAQWDAYRKKYPRRSYPDKYED